MAAITTTRAIARFNTDSTRFRNVDADMILRDPDQSFLFVLTAAANRKEGTDEPKFEWIEDQEVTFWGSVSNGTTSYSSVATNLAVADVTIFCVGDEVVVPAAATTTSDEVMLVTAIAGSSTGTITVTRNVGSAGADTIGATASLRIIASSLTEDSDTPTQRYQAQTAKASYAQIFRTPVQITHTAASSKKYGGNDRKQQLVKALVRHRNEIEGAGLWSRAAETLSGPSSQWTTMGVKSIIATNKTNANTTLTNTVFNNFGESAFRFNSGKNQKLLLCSARNSSAINSLAQGKLNAFSKDKAFGVSLMSYIAPLGEFLLKNHFRIEDGVSGANGFNDEAYAIDLDGVKIRYLDGGEGLIGDTKLYQDVQQDGTTVRVDEYRSQIGWQFIQEAWHSLLYNSSTYN
jgi:hypothetical protein